ncbi:hypothetical protein GCM10009623_06900 [Nocardioides aestuarii]
MKKFAIPAVVVLWVWSKTHSQTASPSAQVDSAKWNMAPSMSVAQARHGRGSATGAGLRYAAPVTSPLIRRTALLLVAATVPVLVASPAGAEVPEGWSNPDDVSFLHLLLTVAGIPLVLAVLIALAVYLPALARGEKVAPGATTQDEWFGGPNRQPAEIEAGEARTTGGGSGSW